ncbi:hypothetical protein K3495_g5509 [Podosphaera aphanis]|nr:hypothetical protein K3495_g5509 [Podosphaera aphanis]
MPPPRCRPDESRTESSNAKEKAASNNPATSNGKGRRTTGPATTGSSLRDTAPPNSSSAPAGSANSTSREVNSIDWSSFESSVLHTYRYDYRLDTPAAFSVPYNQMTLSRSPIGRMSPTMAGRRGERRQSKDQLAAAVRKHFKSMGIVENEIIVEFLYKVRNQDTNFRQRFTPHRLP